MRLNVFYHLKHGPVHFLQFLHIFATFSFPLSRCGEITVATMVRGEFDESDFLQEAICSVAAQSLNTRRSNKPATATIFISGISTLTTCSVGGSVLEP